MLKKRIIPCLLLKKDRCVKGINFSNHRDVGHPITNAKIYDAQGADELIFLDITASAENHNILLDIVSKTADECFMPLTVGGGIRGLDDIEKLMHAGADKIAINTKAIENPGFITQAAKKYGKQCIVVSVDYKLNKEKRNEVFIESGTVATGLDPFSWANEAARLGAGEILLTNIDREGTRAGYDIPMIKKISCHLTIPLIASGGVGTLEDLQTGISAGGAQAVSLASILHFTDQNVIKARNYLNTAGIPVRINA